MWAGQAPAHTPRQLAGYHECHHRALVQALLDIAVVLRNGNVKCIVRQREGWRWHGGGGEQEMVTVVHGVM